jgi:hypothetical protein
VYAGVTIQYFALIHIFIRPSQASSLEELFSAVHARSGYRFALRTYPGVNPVGAAPRRDLEQGITPGTTLLLPAAIGCWTNRAGGRRLYGPLLQGIWIDCSPDVTEWNPG